MPQIAPIIVPKMMSFRRVRLNENVPSSKENTKKARIIKKNPINAPFIMPFSFTFLSPKNTPRKIATPLMTWFTGEIMLSETLVNLKIKAKRRIATSETQSEVKTPFKIGLKNLLLPSVFNIFAFNFIIDSFIKIIRSHFHEKVHSLNLCFNFFNYHHGF